MPHQTIWPTQTHAQHNLPIVTHKHAGGKDPDKGNHTQNFSDFLSPSKKQKQTYTKQQTIDEELIYCNLLLRLAGHWPIFHSMCFVTKTKMGKKFTTHNPTQI
jgi:hypothetical protein